MTGMDYFSTEKISFPSAGLHARNLRDSVAGAHPVPRLGMLAGFSHPRNPKISKLTFGPDCGGKRNCLLREKRPSPRAESDSLPLEFLERGGGETAPAFLTKGRGGSPPPGSVEFLQGIRLRPAAMGLFCRRIKL